MVTVIEVPITITPAAQARVRELGADEPLERMLDYTRRTIPRLHSITVDRYDDPDEPAEPRVVITAWQNGTAPVGITDWQNWIRWFGEAFPPTIGRYFGFSIYDRE